jgi:hypothetical protein
MTDRLERASTYRDHARELRVIAKEIQNEERRKLLYGIAEEYEKLAVRNFGQHISTLAGKSL